MNTQTAQTKLNFVDLDYRDNVVSFTINAGKKIHTRKVKSDDTINLGNQAWKVDTQQGRIVSAENSVRTTGPAPLNTQPKKFDINQRFDFMEKFVKMVIDGINYSQIITGEGGLGKTHMVNQIIQEKNLVQDEDYTVIKGYSTPKALYEKLFKNKNGLVVFDDCDSVLKDPNAVNLLKAALDGQKRRTISWLSKPIFGGSDLPTEFDFTGQVIFISNLPSTKLDGALKSRSMCVDLSMDVEDKIQRMKAIIQNVCAEYSIDEKTQVLDWISDVARKNPGCEFNIRTFEKCIKVKVAYGDSPEWKDACEYLMTSD